LTTNRGRSNRRRCWRWRIYNVFAFGFGIIAFGFRFAIGIAFASYTAWFWLVGRYSASRLSAFSFLTPIFGVLAGAWLLSEPVGPLLLLAMALVAAGLWLVNRPGETKPGLRQTAPQ
jgi:drug/metabolite transporter (DMT)-like permease